MLWGGDSARLVAGFFVVATGFFFFLVFSTPSLGGGVTLTTVRLVLVAVGVVSRVRDGAKLAAAALGKSDAAVDTAAAVTSVAAATFLRLLRSVGDAAK